MADESPNIPRYCGVCGEIVLGPSGPRCPECRTEWPTSLPTTGLVASYALLLTELADLRAQGRISRGAYGELRGIYEAKLREARLPRRSTLEARPLPPPPSAEDARPWTQGAVGVPPPPDAGQATSTPAGLPRAAIQRPGPSAPTGPSEPLLQPVKEWAVQRQADLLLYLGAFMLSISALIFVDYQGSVISGLAKSAMLAAYTVAFLAFGVLLHRWERVQEAGPVFVAIGAILTPLNFLNLYVNVLRDDGMPQEWMWLIGSASTCALYTVLALRGFGRLYFIPAAVAFGVAWGSLGATFGLPIEWFGPWFMVLAASIVVAGWRQYPSRMTWFELAAGVMASAALVLTHLTATTDNPDWLARVSLPAAYLGLLAGLYAPAFVMRRSHALMLLPPAGAAGAASTFWAAGALTSEWAGVFTALAAAGYMAVAHFEEKVQPYARVAALATGCMSLTLAHLAALIEATNKWQLPATYAALLSIVVIEANWVRKLGLFAPPLGAAGAMALLWAAGVDFAWWAYPVVGVSLAIAATSRYWRAEPAYSGAGWPMVTALAFGPIPFSAVYIDEPWHGVTSFALSALALLWAALKTNGEMAAFLGVSRERGLRLERQMIARLSGWAMLAAVGYLSTALDLERTQTAWAFAVIGFTCWIAVVVLRNHLASFEEVVAPIGLTSLVVGGLTGLPDTLHVSIVAALAALAASLAAARTGSYVVLWRLAGVGAAAGSLFALYGEPVLVPGETWQVPAVYASILAATLFDAAYRRFPGSVLAVPAIACAAIAAGIWYQQWDIVHYAWAPLGFAAAMAAYSLREGHETVIGKPLTAYASALSLTPLLFVGPYFDLPFAGASAFAIAGGVWGALAWQKATPLSWLFGARAEGSLEPSGLAIAAFAFLLTAAGYLSWGLELQHEDGAWLVAALAIGALAVPALRSRSERHWLVESLICGLGALAIACLASFPRDWQVATFLAAGAGTTGLSAYMLRRLTLMNLVAMMAAGAVAFAWRETGWPSWGLGLVYSGIGIAVYAAFYRLRVPDGQWRKVGEFVSVAFPVLGVVVASQAVAGQDSDEALVKTTEWLIQAVTIAVAGTLLVTEGVLRTNRNATLLGSAVLLGAVELSIASFEPGNVQAFTIPVALYLLGLGFFIRRSNPLFGRHMFTNEGLFVLGTLVLVLPPAQQSFAAGGERWGLLVIAEAVALLGLGLAFAQRWLTVAGVTTLAASGGRFAFTSGAADLPNWAIIGLVGLLLLGLGTLLLFERDWWDRTRSRLAGWWLEGLPPEADAPPVPPPPAPGSEPLDVAP